MVDKKIDSVEDKEYEMKTMDLTITGVEVIEARDGQTLQKAYFQTKEEGRISCKMVKRVTEEKTISGVLHKRTYPVNLGVTEVPGVIVAIATRLPCQVRNFKFKVWHKDGETYKYVQTLKWLEDIEIVSGQMGKEEKVLDSKDKGGAAASAASKPEVMVVGIE